MNDGAPFIRLLRSFLVKGRPVYLPWFDSQIVTPGPLGKLLKMQILCPQPRLNKSETLGVEPSNLCLTSLPGDSHFYFQGPPSSIIPGKS